MNKNIIPFVLIGLLIFQNLIYTAPEISGLSVPPTNAINNVITDSGTIEARSYATHLRVTGTNGITTSGDNITKTLTISGATNSSSLSNETLPVPPASEYTVSRQSTIITNFQKGNGWTNVSPNGCTVVQNTTNYVFTNQSSQITTFGNGTNCSFRSPTLSPVVNLSGQDVSVWIMLNDTTNISDLRLTVTNDGYVDFQNFRLWGASFSSVNYLTPNTWYRVTFSLTQSDKTGNPDLTSINSMQWRLLDNNAGHKVRMWVNALGYFPVYDYPIVTYTFDDSNEDIWTNAIPILDQFHYPANEYFVQSYIGLDPQHMTLTQLQTLQNKNWDISPHTQTHPFLTQLSKQQLYDELHGPKLYDIQNGLSTGADHLAYPHGAFNATVIAEAKLFYKTGRTIAEGCPTTACPGLSETLPPGDPYRLRILNVLNTTSTTAVTNRINLAIQNHDWLILLFHHVVPTGSATPDSTYVTTGTFQNITSTIHNKGIRVMTISQVMNDFSTKQGLRANTQDCGSQVFKSLNNVTGVFGCASGGSGNENSTVTNLGSGAAITTTPSSQSGGNVNLRSIATNPTLSATTNTTSIILNDTGTTPDSSFYHRLRAQSWYSACYGPSCQVNTGSAIANVNATLVYPMLIGKGFTIDKIEFEVTHQGAGRCITGIYDDNGTLYPHNLVVTGTDQSTASTNGTRIDNVNYTFKSDSVYWIGINCSSGTPTLRSVGGNTPASILGNTGLASTGSNIIGYRVTKNNISSGFALDNPYPSTGSTDQLNSNIALVQVRAK